MKRIYKAIEAADIVSFDMFDTLVYRLVREPKHVFYFLGKQLVSEGVWSESAVAFMNERVRAESQARHDKGRHEVSLEEIYDCLNGVEDSERTRLASEECALEGIMVRPTEVGGKMVEYALKCEKKIIVTSDMYLPKDVLAAMLDRCGYNINHGDVFVSSEIGLTKRKGGLFKYLLDRNNGARILHIGDNWLSDYLVPKLFGVESRLLNRESHQSPMCSLENDLSEEESIEYFCLDSLIYSTCDADDLYEEFALACFAPLMMGFCAWLELMAGKESIFFLSREGYFLKECFEAFSKREAERFAYLNVSRRAIIPASLPTTLCLEDIKEAYTMPRDTNALQFVNALGLNSQELSSLDEDLKDANLPVDSDRFRELFETDINVFVQSFKRQRVSVLSYLAESGLSDRSSIVDVGWKGSMQDALMSLLDDAEKIRGFYLGVRGNAVNADKKYGFLYNPKDSLREFECRSMNGLIELLFSAPHGTTVGYSLENGVMSPVLAENELSGTSYEVIRRVQLKVLDVICALSGHPVTELLNLNANVAYHSLRRFGLNPSASEASLFSDFRFFDQTVFTLVDVKRWLTYARNPRNLVEDFGKCAWKGAFLRILLGNVPNCCCLLKIVYEIWSRK